MKLLQAILIVAGVYLAVRLIVRIYGKSILQWAGKKALERVQKQFDQRNEANYHKPNNGETQVEYQNTGPARKKSNTNKSVGEYVDYEEID